MISEHPPDYRFSLGWADDEDKQRIVEQMRQLRRQTMNLRVMPTARLMYLHSLAQNRIVGWGGVDMWHNREYPELFSLHVEPAYRTYTLGLVLELARYTFLLDNGVKRAYARMDRASNYSLLRYRVSNGLYAVLDRHDVQSEWVRLCTECELYDRDCEDQAYFAIDVENFVNHGIRRIGAIDVDVLPRTFDLRPELIRNSRRAELDAQQPYRPYWI